MKLFKVVMLLAFAFTTSNAFAVKDGKENIPEGHIVCQSGSAAKAEEKSKAESNGKQETIKTQEAM